MHPLLALLQKFLCTFLGFLRKKSAEFYECALGVPHQTVELVVEVDPIAQIAILFGRILGLCDNPFNFILR